MVNGSAWSPQWLLGITVLVLTVTGSQENKHASDNIPKCGYPSCPKIKPGMINVHLVPHTHDDVGWLVTVDQYYYKSVQWILDGIINELAADPNKRFIYVEIAFFERWFEEQNNSTKELVRDLVNQGRLEFILGGWSMNDEAATHYSAIIDQHKIGFEYLRNNFGKCGRTKIGWQIDPFGHSREQASLFAQFGFDGLFFGRLDYQDKDLRQKTKTMEMIWRGSPKNLQSVSDLFTGVLPNGYNPPGGFCFDITCISFNPLIKDDPRMHDYNVPHMVNKFIRAVNDQRTKYVTDHLIMTMGSDFNYVQARMFFKEMDKLIKYVNTRQAVGSNINVLYSTPSCYLKALNDANRTWSTKEDDFFPYADRDHGFWTGYFTSRPAIKYYARVVNNFFQSVKRLSTFTQLNNKHGSDEQIQKLAAALGVVQHHDGVSGTAKQAVTYDYAQRLANGVRAGQNVVIDVYNQMIPLPNKKISAPVQQFCLLLNESLCSVSETSHNFQVNLFNPLAHPVDYYARLPVNGSHYIVMAQDGSTVVQCDVMPQTPGTAHIPSHRPRKGNNDLLFKVNLPALGFKTYFIQRSSSLFFSPRQAQLSPNSDTILKGKFVSVEFDSSGHVRSVSNLRTGITAPLTQNYFYYRGSPGNNSKGIFQASGAYIFRPLSNTPDHIPLTSWTGVHKGKMVQEAYQEFSPWLSQVYRVYEDKPYVEIEWSVGPIPVDDNVGKEVVTRYNIPGWNTHKIFYTDSNGREVLERIYDHRPTWNLNQTEPVAGNYYPVNAFATIQNNAEDVQFTVLTDRSQGGASLNNGDIELMVHRRLLNDDGKGVDEALNEPGANGKGLVVRGCHYLILEKASKSASYYRPLAKVVFHTPQFTFSTKGISPSQYVLDYNTQWSGLASRLPPNIHLLTLERFRYDGPVPSVNGTVPHLVRFEHFYEKEEDNELSKPVKFDIKDLFVGLAIVKVQELSLGGNIPIEEVHRLHWSTKHSQREPHHAQQHVSSTILTMNPMQIITLQLDIRV